MHSHHASVHRYERAQWSTAEAFKRRNVNTSALLRLPQMQTNVMSKYIVFGAWRGWPDRAWRHDAPFERWVGERALAFLREPSTLVLRMERFEEAVGTLAATMGWRANRTAHANAGPSAAKWLPGGSGHEAMAAGEADEIPARESSPANATGAAAAAAPPDVASPQRGMADGTPICSTAASCNRARRPMLSNGSDANATSPPRAERARRG